MEKEEIVAMKAGSKLDELVGIHIFGWKPVEGENYYEDEGGISKVLCFNKFSREVELAWQLVEKIRDADNYNFKRMEEKYKTLGQYDSLFVDFCVFLMEITEISVEEYAFPATLTIMRKLSPEIICKAALMAKLQVERD